ncbi:MAG: hypothetical protein KC496_10150, partial [Anaerolineae bacterium]|nr:hypothetical protein [Anaerolineae bacterium]
FFMQTPEERSDGDPTTSDGVYVLTTRTPSSFGVAVGDRITLEGRVKEYYGLTQIEVNSRQSTVVLSSNNPLPQPIDLKMAALDWTVGEDVHPLERYEGMYVRVADAEVFAPTNYFDEFGITLTGERPFREAGVEIDLYPEQAEYDVPRFDLNPELIEVDPEEMGLPVEFVTVGSVVTVTGGLSYSYRDYQIWPSDLQVDLAEYQPRPVRDRAEGEYTIATQNMENFFDLVNDPGRDDSPMEDYVPDRQENYEIRLRKLSEQVRVVLGAPDILAIQEIENARVLTDLIFQIHQDDPTLRYAGCFQEGNDDRGIDNAFIVRTDRVNLLTCERLPGSLTALAPLSGQRLFGRPPLVLEAELLTDPTVRITLVNLHIKSLSGAETEIVQVRRMAQALMVADYVQALLNEDPARNVVLLGDLNSYEVSDGLVDVQGILAGDVDPSEALLSPDYDPLEPNLVNQALRVPAGERYSYIYNSTSQVLDSILTTPGLDAFVTDAQFSRGNADALHPWHE